MCITVVRENEEKSTTNLEGNKILHEWSETTGHHVGFQVLRANNRAIRNIFRESLGYSLKHKESGTGDRFRSGASSDENETTAWLAGSLEGIVTPHFEAP